jgi:peptidoglycan hydrolase CwlO-like protein
VPILEWIIEWILFIVAILSAVAIFCIIILFILFPFLVSDDEKDKRFQKEFLAILVAVALLTGILIFYNFFALKWALLTGAITFFGILITARMDQLSTKKLVAVFLVAVSLVFLFYKISSEQEPLSQPFASEQQPIEPATQAEMNLVSNAYDIAALETAHRNKQQAYNKHSADFNKAKQKVGELENTIPLAQKMLSDYKAKMDDALTKLKKVQERVWDNPDISTESERVAYRQAKMAFDGKNNELKQLQTQLAQAKKDVEAKQAALEKTQNEINRLKRQLKVGSFAHFKAKVEQERTVEGYGEAGCNQQRPFVECKEAAKLTALKDATSKGAIILLDSQTWASLDGKGEWKLTKDEIRIQLRAVLIGHEVLEDNVIGKGSAYYYKISATIKGQVPPDLQRRLLGQ